MTVAQHIAVQADGRVAARRPPPFDKSAPEVALESVPRCPVCTGDSYRTLATGYDYELQTCSNEWRFVRCDGCEHAWLNPRPHEDALSTIYPPSYYAYSYESAVHPLALRAKQILDGWKLRSILSHLASPPKRYLDVGCGSGRFLKSMERRGVPRSHLYGLELDPITVKKLADQGYQVSCGRAETCTAVPESQIDLITMFHVIEHVDKPSEVVRKLERWLAPGGVVALETPNLDSLDARWFRDGYWGGYHIPRHWHIFTPESLRKLVEQAGLKVVAMRYQTGHSFWMYSIHHALRYGRWRLPRLARAFDPFGGSVPFLAGFTALDKVRAALGFRTSSMLLIAQKA